MIPHLYEFAVYLIIVAGLDWLAYLKLHRRWQRRERARTTVGVLLVLVPAFPLIATGLVDLMTWLLIVAGFIIAGAVTLFLDINTQTSVTESLRQEIRELNAKSDQ
jgi:amino acid transporter